MQLLRGNGVEPKIIEYLKNPADESTLRSLAGMMGLRPNQFIRKGEAEFKEGSLMMIPLERTQIKVLAVPKSIAMSPDTQPAEPIPFLTIFIYLLER